MLSTQQAKGKYELIRRFWYLSVGEKPIIVQPEKTLGRIELNFLLFLVDQNLILWVLKRTISVLLSTQNKLLKLDSKKIIIILRSKNFVSYEHLDESQVQTQDKIELVTG